MTPTSNLSNGDSLHCNLEGCQEKLMKVLYCQWLEESSCCDLQLHTPNGNIPVHACVMMAFSSRIADFITVKQRKKRKGKSLEQYIINVKFDYYTVKNIIKSIYSGVFNMTDVSDLHEFYKASNWLRVTELEDIVKNLRPDICNEISSVKPGKRKYNRQKNMNTGISNKKGDKRKMKLKGKSSSTKPCHGNVKDDAEVRRLTSLDIWEDMEAEVDPSKILAHIGSDNLDLNAVKTEVMDEEITFNDGDGGNMKCEKCKAIFTDSDEYKIHIKDHPYFSCDKCPQVYFTQAALFRHRRRSHFKSKHLECSSCDFVATCNSQFSEHCLTVHQEVKPFRCQFNGCSYKTKVYRNLSQHFKIHETFQSFMCDKCEKCFKSFACLKSHKRSCYDMQKYLCDFCGQSFNHPTSMKTHRRTVHFREKPYKCHVCSKSFSENSNFKRHMRIHNKSYPYACPVCSQLFRHSNTLKSHMNKHGGFDQFDISIYKNSLANENDNRDNKGIDDPNRQPGNSNSHENTNIGASVNYNNSDLVNSSNDFNNHEHQDDICDVNKSEHGILMKNKTPQEKSLHKQSSSTADVRPYNTALPTPQFHPFIDYSIPPIQTPPPAHSLPFMNSSTSTIASSFHLLFSGQVSHPDTASPFANQTSQSQENNPYNWYYSQYGPRF